jgi:hypothetical protein
MSHHETRRKTSVSGEVEGALGGLGRDLRNGSRPADSKEQGKYISQSYLRKSRAGTRPHLMNSTRLLLARFFVHPGYLG